MTMRLFRQWGASLCLGFLAVASHMPASAQDLAGAKDHPAVKRFGGSTIVGYEVRNFEAVEFQTSTFKEFDLQTNKRQYVKPPLALEGKLTRLWYEAPGATRSLELYRNYANDLAANGFTALYDSTRDSAAGNYTNFLANFSSGQRDFIKNNRSEYVMYAADAGTVRTGTFQKGSTTVRLVAVDWPKEDATYKSRQGAYMAVDILETKAMEQNMVVVSASDIGKSITASGKVAIYGILFDTGKADVKPESKPSLDQIAAFLKAEPAVKLHVVGHTDSVGGFDSNLALSKRRADAVAAVLAKDYGIAGNRLVGNGVASLAPVANNGTEDGRAKNRRVELVLQ
ncbi:OmpA family protein [Acidovorax sp. Leaf78]|uniref:OmpA family protein n=1 Tax=unclassified Acidovorax TaxID=2684926 RepID=UPI000A7CDBDC|nr:OmpA family protein [Acidovorax sp. Leaf78]